jgi:hypothetical protein
MPNPKPAVSRATYWVPARIFTALPDSPDSSWAIVSCLPVRLVGLLIESVASRFLNLQYIGQEQPPYSCIQRCAVSDDVFEAAAQPGISARKPFLCVL